MKKYDPETLWAKLRKKYTAASQPGKENARSRQRLPIDLTRPAPTAADALVEVRVGGQWKPARAYQARAFAAFEPSMPSYSYDDGDGVVFSLRRDTGGNTLMVTEGGQQRQMRTRPVGGEQRSAEAKAGACARRLPRAAVAVNRRPQLTDAQRLKLTDDQRLQLALAASASEADVESAAGTAADAGAHASSHSHYQPPKPRRERQPKPQPQHNLQPRSQQRKRPLPAPVASTPSLDLSQLLGSSRVQLGGAPQGSPRGNALPNTRSPHQNSHPAKRSRPRQPFGRGGRRAGQQRLQPRRRPR